jgi:hypothetical protein
MSTVRSVVDGYASRRAAIIAIGLEVKALMFDQDAGDIMSTEDPAAERLLYAKAFQAWADGKIGGEAEDIFELVQEALEL